MRFKNIVIDNLDFSDDEFGGNFEVYTTDELVYITNKIREEQGNIDLVSSDLCNEVYYNFYLFFNTDKKEIKLQSVCNNGENDDYVYYDIELSEEEKNLLMFKIVEYFVKDSINK